MRNLKSDTMNIHSHLRRSALPIFAIILCTMACTISCAKKLSIEHTKSIAEKYINEDKCEEALKLIFDNLTDEEIAQNALFLLVKAASDFEPVFQDAVVMDHTIYGDKINSTRLSSDKKLLVTVDGTTLRIRVFSFPDMKESLIIPTQAPAYSAIMDRSGNRIVAAGHDGNVYFYDYPSGNEIGKIHAHDYPVRDLWLTKDGKLITVSNDHTISVFDPESGERLQNMKIHSMNIKNVTLSPDETLVATASNDGSVQTLEYHNGELSLIGKYINAADNYVNAIAISPDKQFVASGSGDGNVKFWGARDHKPVGSVSLEEPVSALSFSPDGTRLIAGTASHVYLIDAVTKQAVIQFPVIGNEYWSAEFIDNDRVMVSENKSVKIIKIPTTDEILETCREIYNDL